VTNQIEGPENGNVKVGNNHVVWINATQRNGDL